MIQTSRSIGDIPPIDHDETMQLTATENARLLGQLHTLTPSQWTMPTDCARRNVRDIVVHLIASAQPRPTPSSSRARSSPVTG